MTAPSFAEQHGFADEYPFESRWHTLPIGLRYHYLDERPLDSRPSAPAGPLLFVHGNPTWSFAFRHLIRDLSRDRRVLAVDHIGCGLSDKPQDYAYRLADHVANLTHFVEALDLMNITLVGHDWGGCIGMGAAAALPDRFAGFVLMNTAAFRSTRIPLRIAVCRLPLLGPLAVRGLNAFSRAALRMAVAKPEHLSPSARRGYLAPYDSWRNRVAVLRFVQDIPLRPSHASYAGLVRIEQALPRLSQRPFLFVWGERDWCFTTRFLDEWVQRVPDAQVVRLPDAGHYLFEDSPEQVAHALRSFLTADGTFSRVAAGHARG
jgi:haloalkane dehalogenase